MRHRTWPLAVLFAAVWIAGSACDVKKEAGESAVARKVEPKAGAEEPSPDSQLADKLEDYAPCEGDECFVVPEGIMGMSFGMAADVVRERFRRIKNLRVTKRTVDSSATCSQKRAVPERRFRGTTELGGEKAVCELATLSDGGLVEIDCKLDGRRSRQEHAEISNVLYLSLAKQYGKPQSMRENLVAAGRLNATWNSPKAKLVVTAWHRRNRSRISITNTSPALAAAYEDEKAQIQKACDEVALKRKSKADEREQQLREKAAKFEEDLRPPLER